MSFLKTTGTLLIAAFLFFGCSKSHLPTAIDKKIETLKKEPKWNPPAKVYSYTYNGQTVYYFPAHCCDIPGEVLDEKGNHICSPDGGITGNGDGKCTDFFTARTNEKLIWEDKR